jgi:hypothetical protein
LVFSVVSLLVSGAGRPIQASCLPQGSLAQNGRVLVARSHKTKKEPWSISKEHDPRNNTLVSAAWAEGKKHVKYDNLCASAGTIFQPFALY